MDFSELNIDERIKKGLEELKFKTLTPIQELAIPKLLEKNDVIGQAPTGTGKTFAYGIPLINMIEHTDDIQALVLCPTRELAVQVCTELKKILAFFDDIEALAVYGGQNIEVQLRGLKEKPQIIVGTPGRIQDHINRKTLKLNKLKFLVLDEADEMLNMGFKEELDMILQSVNIKHQTMLFSATMPKEIKKIAETYLNNPISIKTLNEEKELPEISQFYVDILEKNKIDCLCRMLDAYNFKQALVFCKTKKNVDDLSLTLVDRGYKVECLHGDLKQIARDKVMKMFKEGIVKVLIATDVAARGLDISGIDVVFNYDIPDDLEYYVHRIGRTARAGRSGNAYTFVNRKEKKIILEYAEKLKTEIKKIDPPTYEQARTAKMHHLLEDLVLKTNKEDVSTYRDYLYTFLMGSDTLLEFDDLAGAILKQLLEGDSKSSDSKEDLTVKVKNESSKKDKKVKGFTRIFINLGKKDNLTKLDLIDIVKTKRHVNKNDIINIDILSTYSFFDIPDQFVSQVINTLNKLVYKERPICAEIAGSRYPDKKNKKEQGRKVNKKHDFNDNQNKEKLKKDLNKFIEKKSRGKHKRIDIEW